MIKSNFIDLCLCPRRFFINYHKNSYKPQVIKYLKENNWYVDYTELMADGNYVEAFAKKYFLEKYQNAFWSSDIKRTDYQKRADAFNKVKNDSRYTCFYHPLILFKDENQNTFYLEIDFLFRQDNGFVITELKASSKTKFVHFLDLLYQCYVFYKMNIPLLDAKMLLLNSKYFSKTNVFDENFPLINNDYFSFYTLDQEHVSKLNMDPAYSQIYFAKYMQTINQRIPNLSGNFYQDIKKFYHICDQFLKKYQNITSDKSLNLSNLPKASLSTRCRLQGMPCDYLNFCKYKVDNYPVQKGINSLYRLNIANYKSFSETLNTKELKTLDLDEIQDFQTYNFKTKKLAPISLNFVNLLQIYLLQNNQQTFIDYINLDAILKNYILPLYFIDFEASDFPLPIFQNTKPYEHIPFQYSCHILTDYNVLLSQAEKKEYSDNFLHYEYVMSKGDDMLVTFCNKLFETLFVKGVGKYVAYNKAYEGKILKLLQRLFPQFNKKINVILKNLLDLKDLFDMKWSSAYNYLYNSTATNLEYDDHFAKIVDHYLTKSSSSQKHINDPYPKGAFYDLNFEGSFSIKSVLPALFNNFSYKNLEIQNGNDAKYAFKKYMRNEVSSSLWKDKYIINLLKYCEQDTLAMVLIFLKLFKINQETLI